MGLPMIDEMRALLTSWPLLNPQGDPNIIRSPGLAALSKAGVVFRLVPVPKCNFWDLPILPKNGVAPIPMDASPPVVIPNSFFVVLLVIITVYYVCLTFPNSVLVYQPLRRL